MKVIEIIEWDNFKDESKLKKYYDFIEKYVPYVNKKFEELNIRTTGATNGTGHMVSIREYPSMKEFDKLRTDDEYTEMFVRWCRTIKNVNQRILRPTMSVPPK